MQAAIEVEKKFTAPDCAWLAKCVKETGGTDIGKKSFTDVYYDTAACVLTRKDIWLRCRDGAWELKLPVEEECAHFLTKTEHLLIRMRKSAVRSHLAFVVARVDLVASAPFSGRSKAKAPSLKPCGRCCLACRASSARRRSQRCWLLLRQLRLRSSRRPAPSGSSAKHRLTRTLPRFVTRCLRSRSWSPSTAEIPSAEEEIARVAALLGAAPLSGAMGGKLETYIRQYCPTVLAQLIDAGVLREN